MKKETFVLLVILSICLFLIVNCLIVYLIAFLVFCCAVLFYHITFGPETGRGKDSNLWDC